MIVGASARATFSNACIVTINEMGKRLKQCFINCIHVLVISQGMFGGLSKAQGGVLTSFMLPLQI